MGKAAPGRSAKARRNRVLLVKGVLWRPINPLRGKRETVSRGKLLGPAIVISEGGPLRGPVGEIRRRMHRRRLPSGAQGHNHVVANGQVSFTIPDAIGQFVTGASVTFQLKRSLINPGGEWVGGVGNTAAFHEIEESPLGRIVGEK